MCASENPNLSIVWWNILHQCVLKHTPNNFAYYIKYSNGDFKPPVKYSGNDTAKVFFEKLKENCLYIAKEFHHKFVSMKTLTEKMQFKTCHICEEPLMTFQ